MITEHTGLEANRGRDKIPDVHRQVITINSSINSSEAKQKMTEVILGSPWYSDRSCTALSPKSSLQSDPISCCAINVRSLLLRFYSILLYSTQKHEWGFIWMKKPKDDKDRVNTNVWLICLLEKFNWIWKCTTRSLLINITRHLGVNRVEHVFFSLWKTWYLEALCWHNIHEQLVNVTSAPRAVSVSMSTAVCRVMWRQPAMRAPFRGLVLPYSSLIFIRPGISFSAISMALRPHSARLMSARREMVRRHVNSVSSSCLQPVFYIFYTSAIIFLLHVKLSPSLIRKWP